MICSECPNELTPEQLRKGNKTCGPQCRMKRGVRIGGRAEQKQRARVAVEADLQPHAVGGMVPLGVAVETALRWRHLGYQWCHGVLATKGRLSS